MRTRVILWAAICSLVLATAASAATGPAALLPASGAAGGWARQSRAQTYTPNNLYEYIDGAADGYLVFGFQMLAHADYAHPEWGEQLITVDVYEMASPEDAFGIYSVERAPDLHFVDLGAQGHVMSRFAAFHQERFYVRLQARRAGEGTEKALLALARAVSRLAPAGPGQPQMLEIFPRPSRIANGEQYIRGALLGHGFLPRGYVVHYRHDGERVRMIAIDWSSPESADEAMTKLRQYHEGDGRDVRPLDGLGEAAYIGEDRYQGPMIVLRQGRLMAAVVGYQDQSWAIRRARTLLQGWDRLERERESG